MNARAAAAMAACLLSATACAAADPAPESGELGVFSFALPGIIKGIRAMEVKVFEGPVTSPDKVHKFELGCIPYLTGADKSNNAFTLDRLPARRDYSVLVNLYSDDGCTELRVRGYRGGIEVRPGTGAEVAASPYYIQQYHLGAFAGFAVANPKVRADVSELSCTTDSDCHGEGGHPAATCVANRCTLDSLFPLNGGSRRAFPSAVTLSNGRVAISGGFSVRQQDGTWAATKERVEVFDPALGRFLDTALPIDNFGAEARVGGAVALPWSNGTWVQVAGSGKAKLATDGKTLVTDLLDAPCATASACPLSRAVWRIDPGGHTSSGTLLQDNVALPIVARVATPAGPRLLVAGGVELPMPQGGEVPRRGEALLCELESGSADCKPSAAKLATGRANAAAACIETSAGGCKRLLIIGGRVKSSAPLAEVYNATSDSYESATVGGDVPMLSHGGELVRAGDRFYLLGATTKALFIEDRSVAGAAPLAPLQLTLDDSGESLAITFTKVHPGKHACADQGARALAAAIGFEDGSALLIGGLGPDNAVRADALLIDKDGRGAACLSIEQGRFGAAIARIGGRGPVAGCVLLIGGLGLEKDGLAPLSRIEVYCPALP